jgi:hypothetical protein
VAEVSHRDMHPVIGEHARGYRAEPGACTGDSGDAFM